MRRRPVSQFDAAASLFARASTALRLSVAARRGVDVKEAFDAVLDGLHRDERDLVTDAFENGAGGRPADLRRRCERVFRQHEVPSGGTQERQRLDAVARLSATLAGRREVTYVDNGDGRPVLDEDGHRACYVSSQFAALRELGAVR